MIDISCYITALVWAIGVIAFGVMASMIAIIFKRLVAENHQRNVERDSES